MHGRSRKRWHAAIVLVLLIGIFAAHSVEALSANSRGLVPKKRIREDGPEQRAGGEDADEDSAKATLRIVVPTIDGKIHVLNANSGRKMFELDAEGGPLFTSFSKINPPSKVMLLDDDDEDDDEDEVGAVEFLIPSLDGRVVTSDISLSEKIVRFENKNVRDSFGSKIGCPSLQFQLNTSTFHPQLSSFGRVDYTIRCDGDDFRQLWNVTISDVLPPVNDDAGPREHHVTAARALRLELDSNSSTLRRIPTTTDATRWATDLSAPAIRVFITDDKGRTVLHTSSFETSDSVGWTLGDMHECNRGDEVMIAVSGMLGDEQPYVSLRSASSLRSVSSSDFDRALDQGSRTSDIMTLGDGADGWSSSATVVTKTEVGKQVIVVHGNHDVYASEHLEPFALRPVLPKFSQKMTQVSIPAVSYSEVSLSGKLPSVDAEKFFVVNLFLLWTGLFCVVVLLCVLVRRRQKIEDGGRKGATKATPPVVASSSLVVSNHVLGRGSNGTFVYKGTFGDSERDVAVKRMYLEADLEKGARSEALLLTKLDEHPNVVRFFQIMRREHCIDLVLELCETTLADKVNQDASRQPQYGVRRGMIDLLRGLAEGVRHLHLNKVVHRDIKPHNILLKRRVRGGGERDSASSTAAAEDWAAAYVVKLSDMGLAKFVRPSSKSSAVSTAHRIGTEGWQAPEVVRSRSRVSVTSKNVDIWTVRTDIWSMGCVFHWAATRGQHPFQKRTAGGTMHLNHDSAPNMAGLESRSPELASLVREMISLRSYDRPSCDEVREHVFFWSPTQRIEFVKKLYMRVSGKSRDVADFRRRLECGADLVVTTDWSRKIVPEVLRREMMAKADYRTNSFVDFIRLIRNCREHYRQDYCKEARKVLDPFPTSFVAHFFGGLDKRGIFPKAMLHGYHRWRDIDKVVTRSVLPPVAFERRNRSSSSSGDSSYGRSEAKQWRRSPTNRERYDDDKGARESKQTTTSRKSRFKTKRCQDGWMKPKECPRGDRCTYAHSPTELRCPEAKAVSTTVTRGRRKKKDLYKKIKCRDGWEQPGKCANGSKCFYAHSQNDYRGPPSLDERN